MTDRPPARDGAVPVAINVAKRRNEVSIAEPGRARRRLTDLNTRDEHDRLIAVLFRFEPPVVVGFDATGNVKVVGPPSGPVDHVRVFRLDLDLVVRTVRATQRRSLC